MEFDKSRVFSSVNADELRAGDKVIAATSMQDLRDEVEKGFNIVELEAVLPEHYMDRFSVHVIKEGDPELRQTALAFLVERKENCTNCGEGKWDAEHKKILCDPAHCGNGNVVFRNHEIEVCEYWKPKTKLKADEICVNCKFYSEYGGYCNKHDKPTLYYNTCPDYCQETEKKADKHTDCNHCEEARKLCAMTNVCPNKHYRPFQNIDELVKVWEQKWSEKTNGQKWHDCKLNMPHIWVRYKKEEGSKSKGHLIHGFYDDIIEIQDRTMSMEDLFYFCEFLDGSPCGVEE